MGPEFRRIWFGNASSNLADGVTFVALPLLAATVSDSPVAIAGVAIASSATRIVTVLGIGALIDRADRRRLLVVANLVRAALFAVLTVLVVADATPLLALYVVAAVMGVVETVSDSSAIAVLPQAVPPDELDGANSRIAGTQTVVDEFVGPPLGGFLFGMAAFAPSALTVLAFLAAAFAYWRLRDSYTVASIGTAPTGTASGVNVLVSIREGAAWTVRQPTVRMLAVIGGVASVAYMIPFSYLVLYARDELELSATGYGFLLSFSALGGLLGSVVAPRLRRTLGYGPTIVAALGLGAVSFGVIALSTHVVVVAIALAAYIAHAVVWGIMATSVRQRVTPAALMGRVGSVTRLVGLLGLTVGAGVGGLLATYLGYRTPFAVAAALFVVAAVVCLLASRDPQVRAELALLSPPEQRA